MLWNEKYWDNFDNIYGTPRFIGLKPIQREKWQITDDRGFNTAGVSKHAESAVFPAYEAF
jgi:hypothetical protein